jgi:hypothetical protein
VSGEAPKVRKVSQEKALFRGSKRLPEAIWYLAPGRPESRVVEAIFNWSGVAGRSTGLEVPCSAFNDTK